MRSHFLYQKNYLYGYKALKPWISKLQADEDGSLRLKKESATGIHPDGGGKIRARDSHCRKRYSKKKILWVTAIFLL